MMTVSTVDVLRAARDLYAQAPSHVPNWDDPLKGEWCVLTALSAAAGPERWPWIRGQEALQCATGTDRLAAWNAEHSTEEVLAAFDRAIEAEQAKAVTA